MPFEGHSWLFVQLLQNWAEAKHLRWENVLIAIMCSSLIDKELREQQHNSMQSQYLARQKALCVADRCRTIILFREYIIKENQRLSQKDARFHQMFFFYFLIHVFIFCVILTSFN